MTNFSRGIDLESVRPDAKAAGGESLSVAGELGTASSATPER
jgi:hypothetical protein